MFSGMTPNAKPAAATAHRALSVFGDTDVGSKREENQDTFVITNLGSRRAGRRSSRVDVFRSRPGVLLLVCDGMGGPPAGDVAARLAAASIVNELRAASADVAREPGPALKRAVEEANDAILAEATAHPEERGMGTTCTAAVCSPEGLSVAQVGDSRAYLLREGQLHRLTRDQTIAARLMEEGVLAPEQLESYPYRHVLAQALGTEGHVEPVITDHDLRENDRVLICSDGLHGPVDEPMIAAILGAAPSAEAATRGLIAAALAAGGPDNVTVVVADCGPLDRSVPR
jgi:serine/threonine protein phosphatase PrpC